MNDQFKWGVAILLFIAGLVANYYYGEIAWALRAAGWIVLACILAGIALQTALGQQFWSFAKDARAELRKVVWPTRPETIQTTAIVVVLVVVASLLLWGMDSVLHWIIGWLTGQRG